MSVGGLSLAGNYPNPLDSERPPGTCENVGCFAFLFRISAAVGSLRDVGGLVCLWSFAAFCNVVNVKHYSGRCAVGHCITRGFDHGDLLREAFVQFLNVYVGLPVLWQVIAELPN